MTKRDLEGIVMNVDHVRRLEHGAKLLREKRKYYLTVYAAIYYYVVRVDITWIDFRGNVTGMLHTCT